MKRKPDAGQSLAFPRWRLTVLDICRAAQSVPGFAVERRIDLSEIVQARRQTAIRIGWAAIFARAYALVAAETAELRQTFVSLPRARIYQHPTSVATIAVNRYDETIGCERLYWNRIRNVETFSLPQLQATIDSYQHEDTSAIFREGRRLERLPWPVRRLAWHLMMRWLGRIRAKRLGTFSLSTLASYGTTNNSHPLVVTSSLSYGPLDDDETSLVCLQADHRIIDGVVAARALVRLEEVLRDEVVAELRALRSYAAAA